MPLFSTLVATILFLFALFQFYSAHLGGAGMTAQMFSLLWAAYLMVSAVSGWLYEFSKKRLWGLFHALSMFGIAAVCGFVSYGNFFGKQHITGGQGPGANPVGAIIMLVALLVAAVGILALMCGIAVVRHVLMVKKDDSHDDKPYL
jgi:hypothetical protein